MNAPHKYTYDFDLSDDNHAGALVVRLVGRGKRVLDVGSGPGSIARCLKESAACRVVAIENDPEAVVLVMPFCEQVLRADLDSPSLIEEVRGAGQFDVIVLADVLEHLVDPWTVLRGLKAMLVDGGYFVVSLPHAGHNAVLAALFGADFEYRDTGLLDRTHLRFFAMRNIAELFESAELQIVEARFVTRYPGVTELAPHWARLSQPMRSALLENRFGSVYQVVVRAQPRGEGTVAINLFDLAVPSTRGSWFERALGPLARRLIGSLSSGARRRVRGVIAALGLVRR